MSRATIHAIRPSEVERAPVGAPGVVLGGKYRLEEAIAEGGMARVWRATHVTLNRPVAVKFVDAWGATQEERDERFLREAKVAAAVRHRHVVDILDFGTSKDGEPYMVMELLEGETLDQRLDRGPIPDDEIVEIASQLLSGLDAVHRAGIVHRDLKPGNVFLTDDEVDGVFARLLDFGISQGADEEATFERVVVGTPEYMSPEQAFGDPLDARSDLYSVGVVLYEMLSGVLPFEDADPQKVVDLVANETPPPLASMRPDIPELCAVVERAMAPVVEARFETAREMRRALLAAAGRGPDVTGRNSVVPRDSRVSGLHARPATTLAAESAVRGGGASDAPAAPADPARRRSWLLWSIASALVILALGAAAGWALVHAGAGEPEVAAVPAESTGAPESSSPPERATPDAVPEAAPAVEAASAGAAPPVPEPAAGDPEPALPGSHRDGDTGAATGARPRARRRAEPATPQPTIRRELDF